MIFIFSFLQIISQNGNRDFYNILNVTNDAPKRLIERSFMKLSRKYHPDKNKGDPSAATRFTDINDAYAVLRDDNKRRIYDIYGEKGVHLYEAPQNKDLYQLNQNAEEDPLVKIIRHVGETNRIWFPVDLIDFYEGRAYPIHLTRRTMCRCPHQGFNCPKCHGKPTMRENVNLSLIIEKGSEDGHTITLKGAGDVSEINGPCDLEFYIYAKKHPFFTRQGDNLLMTVDVTLKEALLGFKKTFTHIDGSKFEIELEPSNIANHTIIVPNKGMPKYLAPGEYGNIIAKLNVHHPKNLTPDQRNQLADALKE